MSRSQIAVVLLALAAGCGSTPRSPPAPAVPEPRATAPREPELPWDDEAPERQAAPTAGPQVTLKLLADASKKAHVFWGRKDLGVAPLEIQRPRGSGPLDLLVSAPGFLPLHTRVFTDRDDVLALRLYDAESARGLLGYPVKIEGP